MSKKYLLIWDRIGDYHRARWRDLGKLVGEQNVFAADLGAADNLYLWQNTDTSNPQYRLFSQKPVHEPDLWGRVQQFRQLLTEQQIDVVCIPGYGRKEYIVMLFLAKMMGKKVVMFAESWYGNNGLINGLKGMLLRFTCDSFIVSGVRAAQHFRDKLGIRTQPIQIGYSVVDNAHFSQNLDQKTAPQPPVLLCVARFSPEKNLHTLIQAFKNSEISQRYMLKLVGGGPLQATLEQLATGCPNIVFSKWLSYSELPQLYGSATAFVLPSSFEPWGLVVNEAMSAGLPLVLSEECGCRPDLLDESNGFAFNAHDLQGLVLALNKLNALTESQLQAMGRVSQQKIAAFSPTTWAKSIIELGQ
ncbi:Glycosyl transferases group 1 [Flexibacter flexilis DSM 6793]|uniref:Glycosyl transferases group 1 n=1 Tax=Flexibacter flexilis DSM 6793 TaxID=927664 RepID=A0A1I1ENF6_9BACT|nr:glycosyltransferase family 4 protein [Flexibacter flexilis]SFB86443.1 Glycosyl transferases group 1 [Flexibacter flexilis DSM 6793]